MNKQIDPATLRSHSIAPVDLGEVINNTKATIVANDNTELASINEQLQLVDELAGFDFGRFLLQHHGINGYWTHYMLTHPWYGRKTDKNNRGDSFSKLEQFILDRSPIILATQQRFEIFLIENQKAVANDAKLACIPGGLLGELLYLDFTGIDAIELIGVDFDRDALKGASQLAAEHQLDQWVNLLERDAWQLGIEAEFDLLSSNGLNIYEPDDEKVIALYEQFYRSLKPGGKLVTSFLTPPPGLTDSCEWDLGLIDQSDLLFQKLLFGCVLSAKFQCYRSTEQTRSQLKSIGFGQIDFIPDRVGIFPTVVAVK